MMTNVDWQNRYVGKINKEEEMGEKMAHIGLYTHNKNHSPLFVFLCFGNMTFLFIACLCISWQIWMLPIQVDYLPISPRLVHC